MNKAELESKHLSELHALAADAGVERYRMLPRAELIEKLADGDGGGSAGGGGGGSSQRSRAPRERKERSPRGGGRDRQRGARDRQSRGGGGDRQARGGERPPRGGDRQRRRPESEQRQQPERAETPAPAAGGEESARPKRRRRRFRKGGKSVRAGELILAAPGGQSIVYGESRQSCTALLRELAAELSGGRGPDPVALLVDPSPEELADWKREAPKAEIVSAGQERHAEDALAQAARRAGGGEAVILLIDSVSRLAESFGSNVAKDLLEEGRAAAGSGSGSLTVVAAVER
jgi:Rho termination factor, N-terminal domain